MTDKSPMTLEQIHERKAILRAELEALDKAEVALIRESSDVKPGDRVRRTFGRTAGAEFVVHEVHYIASRGGSGRPWVSGYQIRKDGTPGMQLKHLYYEWEKVEDGIPPKPS